MKKLFIFLIILVLIGCSTDTQVTVEQFYDADSKYASSTKLQVEWDAQEEATSYNIIYTDTMTNKEYTLQSEETSKVLLSLKAGTIYSVEVQACSQDTCTSIGTASATTEEEYWQVQGTGNSYEEALQIVDDASTLAYVSVNAEEEILYFIEKPSEGEASGVKFARSTSEDGLSFQEIDGYKIQHACDFKDNVKKTNAPPDPHEDRECFGPWYMSTIQAYQALPLASGKVRLIFESPDDEKNTRIMYLESETTAGLDFNSEEGTSCITEEDWNGPCKPTIAIGIDGDEEKGSSGLTQARQFKVGYPKQTSWVWDESVRTFMVITGADSCEQTKDGLFYAVWDGIDWIVEKDESGCAKPLVTYAHGPVLVDLSQTTYKLYYEEQTEWIQDYQTPKPLQMIYADATSSGDQTSVDLEDWESESVGRDVHFIWPNGEIVPDEVEPGFGDHYIYLPTNDLNYQVMYMNLGGFDDKTWSSGSYGLGAAILVNP